VEGPRLDPAHAREPSDPKLRAVLKLTIITPTLNQGRFIERAILSVLDQGYAPLEYLVLDGGSTDETADVIRRYEERIDWWVSEPDAGQTDALNKGLARATGDVIAYLNSDDYYLPGAFETALGALERNGASWVAGAAINVDEHDRPGPGAEDPVWVPLPPRAFEGWPHGRQWWVSRPWLVPQPSTFWRRALFDRYGPFRQDMHFGFDAELMIRLLLAGEEPLLLPEERLSARVFHPQAKSADLSRTDPDLARVIQLHRAALTRRERLLLRVSPVLERLQWALPPRKLLHRLMRLTGDLLEYVPERIRPKIRRRDRRAP
jgi:glycosyltransferase involved in cell wall biosynthesis